MSCAGSEYARLDAGEHIYLDYTGGGLYAELQLRQHQELLRRHVFGNPHSSNPTSLDATRFVEHAREYVLRFFQADPAEYDVIFTQNASGALKLVGESYPFAPGSRYLLTFDNHNSVNGIREFAHARRAQVTYIPLGLPDMRVDDAALDAYLRAGRSLEAKPLCLPGAIQFLLGAASAGMDRAGARPAAGMCCWMRPPSRPPTHWT